jgi:ADP-ribosylglycohydrolase
MKNDTINHAIQAAFVADAYCLGSHWIYDEAQLKTLPIDWEELNAPQAMWHKGKSKGDFTHYGDHGKWLHEFIQKNRRFDITMYGGFWQDNMQEYKGYIDGSSRETLEALTECPNTDKGSTSHDLSIIGRIAPLLLVSDSKEKFLKHVQTFVALTHNSTIVLKAAALFASVLYDVTKGKSIDKALQDVDVDPMLKSAFDAGVNSKGQDTFSTIRNFGPACGVEGGFEGVLHLLVSYDDFKEAMIANAKAGGDTSARAMIVAMIMGAAGKSLPDSWIQGATALE